MSSSHLTVKLLELSSAPINVNEIQVKLLLIILGSFFVSVFDRGISPPGVFSELVFAPLQSSVQMFTKYELRQIMRRITSRKGYSKFGNSKNRNEMYIIKNLFEKWNRSIYDKKRT